MVENGLILDNNVLFMAISIARMVRELIDVDLSIQDSLYRGYGNISAIARILKPRVEESLGKNINIETLITSVKRANVEYIFRSPDIQGVLAESTINVKTDVTKMTFERTVRTLAIVRRLLSNYQEEFLQISEGLSSLTLIFNSGVADEIRSSFQNTDILEEEPNLAAIIVHSPPQIIKTPGCAIAFYNQVSRSHINIDDTSSCYRDTIIVVNMREVGKAFTALTELISNARYTRKLSKRRNSIT